MNIAIVYCSQTGFTARYAKWLAEDLGCEAIPYAERARVDLDGLDVLVFCSWFHASSVVNAKWAKRVMTDHPDLRVVLLVTGATPMPESEWSEGDEVAVALEKSFPKDSYPQLERFYCHGGFDFDRLAAPDKIAMRIFFKMQKKNAADPKTAEMLEVMRAGFDGTNRDYLTPVVDYVRSLG